MRDILGYIAATVLSLVALTVVVAVTHHGITSSRAARAWNEVQVIASAARNLYAGQTGYCGTNGAGNSYNISMATLLNSNAIPSEMISGTNVLNPWGGTVTIAGIWNDGTQCEGFEIFVNNIPNDACSILGTYQGDPPPAGFTAVSLWINGNGWTYTNGPPDPGWVTGQCTAGSTGNSVAYGFR